MKLYTSVDRPAREEYVVNKSRFIGRCWPVEQEQKALALLAQVRKEHYDASHNAYAYALGHRGEIARYSDDGEPGGTAGLPMMEVLRQKELTNVLVTVTRYFGGVLLGAGGLVRAYGKAAGLAADAAGRAAYYRGKQVRLVLEYGLYPVLEPLLRETANGLQTEFLDRVTLEFQLLESQVEPFLKQVQERACGSIAPEILGDCVVRLTEIIS